MLPTPASDQPDERSWPRALPAIALVVGVFALLFARAMSRPLDLDEHQFLAPAMLLNQEHARPYLDYPLFHMPSLYYIYAGLIRLGPNALLIVRTFSALLGTAVAMLLFLSSFRWSRGVTERARWLHGLAIIVLYMGARVFTYSNGWCWNHDASILPAFGATLLAIHAIRTGRIGLFACIGFLLAFSATIRLTTAPAMIAVPVAAALLPAGVKWGKRVLALALAGSGGAIALIPAFLAYRAAPDEFLFGNFGVPRLYRSYVQSGSTHHTTLPGKVGHFFQTWLGDPGNAAVLIVLALALIRIIRERAWRGPAGRPLMLLLVLCPFLWLGASAPYQMQVQYHAVLLPFFLLLITLATATSRSEVFRARSLATCLAGLVVLLVNFPRWYWPVIHLASPSTWTPIQVQNDAEWLAARVGSNALVLTIDPIVPLAAGLHIYPEFATGRLTLHLSPYMTDAQREKYHYLWGPQLEARLRQRPPDAIFYRGTLEDMVPDFVAHAAARGFTRQTSPDGEYTLWAVPLR